MTELNSKSHTYILDANGNVVPVDILEWGRWMNASISKNENRCVAQTRINKDVYISTVFLGVDHNFSNPGDPPVLWETMVFGGEYNEEQERYSSGIDAIRGHVRWVDKCLEDEGK
jgi:hypothetical protein